MNCLRTNFHLQQRVSTFQLYIYSFWKECWGAATLFQFQSFDWFNHNICLFRFVETCMKGAILQTIFAYIFMRNQLLKRSIYSYLEKWINIKNHSIHTVVKHSNYESLCIQNNSQYHFNFNIFINYESFAFEWNRIFRVHVSRCSIWIFHKKRAAFKTFVFVVCVS